jgi:tetratricopeptide (TPR) repeat protein
MGTVYEAIDTGMSRRVALKILSRHQAPSGRVGDRFAREAWIGGRLSHPNLVRVFGRGTFEDLSFYSMELVDGGSLHDAIVRLRRGGRDDALGLEFGGREYVAWAIAQVIEAARGLDYAHRNGVVHRDVKPANILLSRDPRGIKVADFGLAFDLEATRLTTAGAALGTFAYMAPEQIRGDTRAIDARTDVYALGVTLFELLTLELPYTGTTQQAYSHAVLTTEPRRPGRLNARVGRDLEIVLKKALEKDPKDRYPSAAAFAEDLENVLALRPIRARPPTRAARLLKWSRRRPMHATLAAVLIVGLPALAFLGAQTLRSWRLLARAEIGSLWEEARGLSREERFEAALAPLSAILERDPEHLEALRTRAVFYHNIARDEADPSRRAALFARALEDIDRLIAREPEAAWTHRLRAFVLAAAGRDEEARQAEAEASRLRGAEPSADDLQIDGMLALASRDHERAVAAFTSLIALKPGAFEAFLDRGTAYRRLGDEARAIADLRVAVGLNPGSARARDSLGRLLTRAGSLEEGEAHHREAIRLDPDRAAYRDHLAINLIHRARGASAAGGRDAALALLREAEAESRGAIALDPDLPGPRLNLGVALMERRRLSDDPTGAIAAEAIAQYEAVAALCEAAGAGADDAACGNALVNLCDALIEVRDLGRALDVCRRVAERSPGDPVAHYNLAGVYALLGRPGEALAALERDVALGDTDGAYLAADPWFAALRGDPRFQRLLRRMERAGRTD